MKVVLDTNVLISALLWRGAPNELLKEIENKTLTLCITSALLEELEDVLTRPKFSFRIKERKTSCEELLAAVIDTAQLHPDRKIDPVVKEDPEDNRVLSCALTAGAEYILTGDHHLLKLKNWSGISILPPRKFLNHINK